MLSIVKKLLMSLLKKDDTIFWLFGKNNPATYPPEQKESLEKNWIFFLKIKVLSDHLFWVIVDRTSGESYVYGFN